jgi:hypothetical protein
MRRVVSALCSFILGIGIVLAGAQLAMAADKQLQGTWTATKAERDGKPAADVVGHRLFFSGDRFEIQSRTGSRSTREPSGWTLARNRRRLTSSTRKVV